MVQTSAVIVHAAANAKVVVMPVEAEALYAEGHRIAPSYDEQWYWGDSVSVTSVEGRLHDRPHCQVDVPRNWFLVDIPCRWLLIGRIQNALRKCRQDHSKIANANGESYRPLGAWHI